MNPVRRALPLLKQSVRAALRPVLARPSVTPLGEEQWGLSRTVNGELALGATSLRDLAAPYSTPLHVVHARRLRDNAARFLSPAPDGSRCDVFYSYKTNPVPGVLQELHGAGIGAEVISHYELWLALALGVEPRRIVFNGPAKGEAAIRMAIEAGIELLNINHREEIAVVARCAADLNKRVRVGLRVTGEAGWAGQFGIPLDHDQALDAFREALACPHLDVVGLHAHRGGMVRTAEELLAFAEPVLGFAERLHATLALAVEVIDFGGSLAAPAVCALSKRDQYFNRVFDRELPQPDPRGALSIEAYVATLVDAVQRSYRGGGRPRPRIFLEPGRALTSDAQLLLARVVSLKSSARRSFAILDAGINVAESCRSEYHQLLPVTAPRSTDEQIYTVVGPICTPGDTLYWSVRLPRLAPGDLVAIMDAGAYFVPFSTAFSFPRPGVVMVDDAAVTAIRRAESFDDLVNRDAQHSREVV